MKETILKYGGSSVSSAENILKVANLIVDHYLSGKDLGVVVSGLGVPPGKTELKITDKCLAANAAILKEDIDAALEYIDEIKDKHYEVLDQLGLEREIVEPHFSRLEDIARQSVAALQAGQDINEAELSDSIVDIGELSSTPIVAAVVQRKLEWRYAKLKKSHNRLSLLEESQLERLEQCDGDYTATVEPGDVGFITDSNFTQATLLDASLDTEIARHYQSLRAKNPDRILFYPGFIAKDEQGNRTTLGRDGSNVTAIALGTAVKASRLIIYSDTEGVLITDPRIIGGSQTMRQLSYKEVVTLAKWGGMKVVQDNSLRVLNRKGYSLPIDVRNTFNPDDPGTTITKYPTSKRSRMKGVGKIDNVVYREFELRISGDFDNVVDAIEAYQDTTVLHAACERTSTGSLIGKYIIKTTPKSDRDNEEHFGKKFIDHIKTAAFNGEIKRFENETYFHYPGCSLVTFCGEGLGESPLDYARIVNSVAQLQERVPESQGEYHLPILRDNDKIQVVIPTDSVDDIIRSTYNQLKRINIILYGLGNVGVKTLIEIKVKYDELGLNVVGVADSTGVLAKIGGFSALELDNLVDRKIRGHKIADKIDTEHTLPDALFFKKKGLKQILDMEKGDFVVIDATNDPNMVDVHSDALHFGADVIAVNKTPYVSLPLKAYASRKQKVQEYRLLVKQRRIFQAILEGKEHVRGTVGADLGIPGALLDLLSTHPYQVSITGCMSGTLGYTLTKLERGRTLSEAINGAIQEGYTEPHPFDDYSGRDVLNKTLILWRIIATHFGIDFNNCALQYETFIQSAIARCEGFNLEGLSRLKEEEFVERMKELDNAFTQVQSDVDEDYVLRYVAEISYDDDGYKISVGLKSVHKNSTLGGIEGTDNLVLFGINGKSPTPYKVEPGPGAGVPHTANAIMHDLAEVIAVAREESARREIPYQEFTPERIPKGQQQHIRWSPPSVKARKILGME